MNLDIWKIIEVIILNSRLRFNPTSGTRRILKNANSFVLKILVFPLENNMCISRHIYFFKF